MEAHQDIAKRAQAAWELRLFDEAAFARSQQRMLIAACIEMNYRTAVARS